MRFKGSSMAAHEAGGKAVTGIGMVGGLHQQGEKQVRRISCIRALQSKK